jgi:hypothetical protein
MRVFGQRVLECAKAAGFTHLALEALREDGAAVTARGYVTPASGLYTREPQLARMVEEAIDLDYQIVNYDVLERSPGYLYTQDVDTFAAQQATNLLAKTYATNPDIKVLVWTGPLQARKRPWIPSEGLSALSAAGRMVQAEAGIEAYSLEQVALDPDQSVGPATPSGMHFAAGPNNGACAGAFYPNRQMQELAALDGIVFHIPQSSDTARWDWLYAVDDERMTVTSRCASCTGQLLVRAYPAGANVAERVPTDQALCNPGAACQFVLPPGDYQFAGFSAAAALGVQTATLAAGGSAELTF